MLPDMEEEREQPPTVEEEVRQLVDLLRVMARVQGYSNAALARKSGVPIASLVRYFKGEGEPKIEFLLASLRALGLGVREFFELAYPQEPHSAARVEIETLLGPIRHKIRTPPVPPPPPKSGGMSRSEIEKMLLELHREVRRLADPQGTNSGAKASEPPGTPEDDG